MDGTIIQQGSFTSTGAAQVIQVRSDVDWMRVYNFTEASAANASRGVHYYWQRGLAANNGFVTLRNAAANAVDVSTSAALTVGGFTLQDSSVQTPGAAVALTAISSATPPVVTTASTAALLTGDVVRIQNVAGAQQFGGYDFTITVINGTTFSLPFAPTIVAGTTGFFRKIPFQPLFYPRRRLITGITAATSAVIKMSVAHGFTVGQTVRLVVPAAFGMTQMDGLQGVITAQTQSTTVNTITVNIDSSAFTAFSFPLTAAVPFTFAEVIPVGEDTAQALSSGVDLLADATLNTGYIGISLAAGITSPAGSVGDVIYWVAGKSVNV
jgi:hypothetical protein